MLSSVFMFFLGFLYFLYIHHGYLVAAFLVWLHSVLSPMVEEMLSYASYGRRKNFLMPPMVEEKAFLCLIRRRFTCAGFSLFYNVAIFYFVLLVGLTSAEYFHPSYFFLYITSNLFLTCFACFSWNWSFSAWWQLFLAATVV